MLSAPAAAAISAASTGSGYGVPRACTVAMWSTLTPSRIGTGPSPG
jgi:hypothetical protein